MEQNDFQKTGYWRCRKCGRRNPMTADRCQNYSCGADFVLYGETIGPTPEPDNPGPDIKPVSPSGSGDGAGKSTANNSDINNSDGGTSGAGGNTGGAGGMNSHGSGSDSTGGSAGKTGGNSTKDENDPSGKSGGKKKKRGKRRIIKILIALLCILGLSAVLIFVRFAVGGSAGDNVHWSINLLSGEMTISGSGDMDDYSYLSSSKRPWVFEHVNASVVLDKIQTAVIEDGVTSIGDYAFASCHNLTSIAIPDSMTSIGEHAFSFCDSLTSITIPDGVTSIGDYAFSFCDSLTDVYYAGSEIAWAAIEIGSYNDDLLDAEIHYGTVLPDGIALGMDTGYGILLETLEQDGAIYGLTDEDVYVLLYVYPETETLEIPDTIDGYSVAWIYAGAMESAETLTELILGEMTCYDYSLNMWRNTYVSTITYIKGSLAQSWMITCDIADALNESRASDDEIIPDLLTAMAAKIRAQELAESYTVERPDGSEPSTALDECGVAYTSYGSSGGYCALDDDLGYWDLYEDVEALLEEYETEVSSIEEYSNIGIGLYYDTDCVYVFVFFTSEETSTDLGSGNSNSGGSLTWTLEDGVTSITVPDGVRSITNPESITSIENYAFESCDSLTDFYYAGSESAWAAIEIVSFNDSLQNAEIHNGTEEQSSGSLTWTLEDGVLTISGSGDMTDYEDEWHVPWYEMRDSIQTVVIEYGVTSIGNYAFVSCQNLTSLAISDSVTSIGDQAFPFCESLTSITIPESVTNIGYSAFCYCTSLTSITIPDGVTSIGEEAFKHCDSLISITIPDSVTSIGFWTFAHCDSLTSVTIPNSVTSIGSGAFYSCDSLADVYYAGTESDWAAIEILSSNDSLLNAEIHYGTEEQSDGSLTWTLEDGVLTISGSGDMTDFEEVEEDMPWYEMRNSIQTVVIENGVTSIGDRAFCFCESLTSITIPDSVTSIGDCAFASCDSLTSIAIPDGVTSIGVDAFQSCKNLISITIPDSVTSIGRWAFRSCDNLTDVYYAGTESAWAAIEIDSGNDDLLDAEIHYGTEGQSGGSLTWTLENGVLTISSSGDMADCEEDEDRPWYEMLDSIQTVVIENGVTSIGDSTFAFCYSLTRITIPDSVTSIGGGAFDGCDSLTDVYYAGSESAWAAIEIGSFNDSLLNAEIHYGTEGQSSGSLTWTLEDGVLTISGSGDIPDYEPDYENGEDVPWYEMRDSIQTVVIENGVTSIGNYAFYICESLTNITIPDSVTSIGDYAFWCCTSLTSITIPESVTSIGDDVFSQCYSLTSISISDNITNIGNYAFSDCDSLTSITIPDGVTSIGLGAFIDCDRLTSITIPDSVTSIGNHAFYICDNLTDVYYSGSESAWAAIEIGFYNDDLLDAEIHYGTEGQSDGSLNWTLEDGVLTISGSGDMTDYENHQDVPWYEMQDSIQTVVIEDGVTSIGDWAFWWCDSLTSITIPESVTSIGDCAFYSCDSLTSITIPESVTTIGHHAFAYCDSLTSITIPDSVTSIGDSAFSECKSLTSITIPDSVTSIGFWAFHSCDSLTDVYYSGSESDWTAIEIDSGNDDLLDAEIHYGTEEQSASSLTWALEDGVLTISGSGDMTDFEDEEDMPWYEMRYSIQTVVIENGVTSIGGSAFAFCYSLTRITIPDSVTSIGVSAFYDCYNLTSITIPDGVTSIGNFTFNGCYNLTSITIPDSVTSIGDCAFDSCYSLTDVYYAGSESDWAAIEIGSSNDDLLDAEIHYGTEEQSGGSLTWTLENGVLLTISGSGDMTDYEDEEDVPWYEMRDSIQTVVIEDGVTSIGNRAFWRCDSLTSITIPESVTSIGDYAFYSCDSLTSITIPESVTNIGHSVFEFCYNLTSITIPDSVMSIGRCAFYFCDSLTDVYYAGTESAWAAIEIGSDNDSLLNAEIHYGS